MTANNTTALLMIDLQNDYFEDGLFPLWQAEQTKDRIIGLAQKVAQAGGQLIHVQHQADPAKGPAPFFNADTTGVQIHPDVLAAAPGAPVIVKRFADAFFETDLEDTLDRLGVTDIWVCGMMTQNCVTHTALSKTAEKYRVSVVADGCTTQTELLHHIAVHALSTRMSLVSTEAL